MLTWFLSLFVAPEDAPLLAPRSSKWPALSAAVLKEEPRCRVCGQKAEVVHHKIPVHVDATLELMRANCAAVCHRCHLLIAHLNFFASWNESFDSDAAWWSNRIACRPMKT